MADFERPLAPKDGSDKSMLTIKKPEVLNKLTNRDPARTSIVLRCHYCWLHENGSLGEENTTAPPTGTVSLVGPET